MKCHYEVLDISREADDNEVKQAYRKLALKWHPDKNLNDTEYAKEQFQLVQQAYEVLSDRQERAWYDKHREQILRGSNSDYKDNNLDVFQYFTTTCFKGYGDDEKGFYCTYAKVFEQIAKEDLEYMEEKDEMYDIPKFGNSESDYDEMVGPFYDYWTSYSTKKSYVWLDPHDIKDAPNRKIFKLIEKENDKIRQKAKKERNEEVRSLVAFVRKRDRRVQTRIKNMEAKKIENREKQKKLTNQKRIERIKELNESSEQAEWMKFDNVKTELEEIEKKLAEQFGDDISDSGDDSDLEDISNLYCVACNKIFKTPKAFKNHESSKKHKENIENLKHVMTLDDLVNEEISDKETENNILDNEDSLSTEDTEIEIVESKSKKKNKKPKNIILHNSSDIEENILENIDNHSEEEFKCNNNKKQKQRKKKEKLIRKEENDLKSDDKPVVDKGNIVINGEVNGQQVDTDKDKCCVKCNAQFSSKNKLFEHLKKTGHSTYPNLNFTEKTRKKGKQTKINIPHKC